MTFCNFVKSVALQVCKLTCVVLLKDSLSPYDDD